MPDPAAVSTLRAVLRAEIEGHRALIRVLYHETEALRTADPEAVAVAASAKLRHVSELEALARQRTELLISLGVTITSAGVDTAGLQPLVAAELRNDWTALRAVAAEAQQTNALNGRLIARHQRHCEAALGALLQARPNPVYGADGRPRHDAPARAIAAI